MFSKEVILHVFRSFSLFLFLLLFWFRIRIRGRTRVINNPLVISEKVNEKVIIKYKHLG